jgi:hypothetical protein
MNHLKHDLKTLQAQFQACLIDADDEIEASVLETPNFNAQDRMAVYINAYYLRLVDILGKDFPALKLFCGEDKFDEAAFAYLAAHPSQNYSLYQLGKDFSAFLKTYLSNEPIIAELAAFERALSEVLLAGKAKRLGVQTLLDLTPSLWPTMQLLLHPAVQFLDLIHNTPLIWRALNTAQPLPAVEVTPHSYLIWRLHLQPHFRALDAAEAHILNAIDGGHYFAEICENLIGHLAEEEIPGFVARVIQQWVMNGVFVETIAV